MTKKHAMTAADFIRWRKNMNFTQEQAAAALNGLSVRAIKHYEGGTREIPCLMPLACAAITFGVRLAEKKGRSQVDKPPPPNSP